MKEFLNLVKSQIPFELKRPSSLLALILALLFTGFVLAAGTKLFELFYTAINPFIPTAVKVVIVVLTYPVTVKINLLSVTLFIIVFFTIYRIVDRFILKKIKNSIVFSDDFKFSNLGWLLNYWGSNNPDKTCYFENSALVFEALPDNLIDDRKEYGAYIDLYNGVYEGGKYEISAWIRSEKNTTMGFKLWVHDTKGHNERKYPANFYTPGTQSEEIKVGFTGTSSQGLRIHLHNKAGKGKIFVDKVTVVKIK